jgi:hypothetical protein
MLVETRFCKMQVKTKSENLQVRHWRRLSNYLVHISTCRKLLIREMNSDERIV